MNDTTPITIAIIPCGGAKVDSAAPARDLYTGSMFRHTLAAVEASGDYDAVLILSAKHGLVELDTVLAPYDVTMGDADAITVDALAVQAQALGFDAEDVDAYGFLPGAYLDVLDEALRTLDVYVSPVYEAAPGIGYQRQVNRLVATPRQGADDLAAAA